MSDGPRPAATRWRGPPATTLRRKIALPNRVLGGGVCLARPLMPLWGSPVVRFCCALCVGRLLVRSLPASHEAGPFSRRLAELF
jgi:hypothetical protein